MANLSAIESYNRHAKVLELLAAGASIKSVARELAIPPASVRRYRDLPLPTLNPSVVMDSAVALKAARPDYGAHQVLDNLAGLLSFDRNDSPLSEAVLKKSFRAHGLTRRHQLNRTGAARPEWWLCEYDRPLRCFQLDTVKVVLSNGLQVEIFSALDVHSRAMWLEVLPRDGSLVYCLSRAFAALGVPEMISTDNGLGWNAETRSKLSAVAHYAFTRGVKEFHFIPVATPWYNGLIERAHRTIKRGGWLHDGVASCQTPEDVSMWLNRELLYQNSVKTHSGISSGNRSRRTPAQVHGCYNHLPVAPHNHKMTSDRAVPVSGLLSYTRQADSRGFCRIDAPSMLVHIPSGAAWGNMFRLVFDVQSGAGLAYLVTADGLSLVGEFSHQFAGAAGDGHYTVGLVAGLVFDPLPYDEAAELERQRKHLRKGRRLPLPTGFFYRELPGGEWEVVSKSGHVVTTSQHLIVDHRAEVLGEGW